MIELRFASLDFTPDGAVTNFHDGSSYGALPHDTPEYHYLAYRYGHAGDTLAYCRAHELCHHLVAEGLGSHSLVLWSLAHGEQPAPMIAASEEALTMALHRYAMTGEPPMIEHIAWDALKGRFHGLVATRDEGDLL